MKQVVCAYVYLTWIERKLKVYQACANETKSNLCNLYLNS